MPTAPMPTRQPRRAPSSRHGGIATVARPVRPHPPRPRRAGAPLDAAIEGDEAFAHAHNLWLNWAVEAGVAGLLAVLARTMLVGIVAVRAAGRGSAVAAAAGAGLAGFAVMSLADHPANAVRLSLALWVVLALVAAEAHPLSGRRSGRRPRGTAGCPRPAA